MNSAVTMLDPVTAVRHFNRFYTQAIGLLGDKHLGSGLTLGQARLLFEIGRLGPVETRALQRRLGLDAGYLSRVLSELESTGLVARSSSPDDRRAKRVSLTSRGMAKLDLIDHRSDAAVTSMLEGLAERDRERLISAMIEIQQLLCDDVEILEKRLQAEGHSPGGRDCGR